MPRFKSFYSQVSIFFPLSSSPKKSQVTLAKNQGMFGSGTLSQSREIIDMGPKKARVDFEKFWVKFDGSSYDQLNFHQQGWFEIQ